MSSEIVAQYDITAPHAKTRKIACRHCGEWWAVPKCWVERPPANVEQLLREHLLAHLAARPSPPRPPAVGVQLHPPSVRQGDGPDMGGPSRG